MPRRKAFRWNEDKPHRCPTCHAVAVDTERPKWHRVYVCCRCGVNFTRWPGIAPLLGRTRMACSVHGEAP